MITVFRFFLLAVVTLMNGLTAGFSPRPTSSARTSSIAMGFFDFKPMKGSGSGKEDLDEQWRAQQALLEARRSGNMDKAYLREKYKDRSINHFNMMLKDHEHLQHMDAMHLDSVQHQRQEAAPKVGHKAPAKQQAKFKFFWEK